MGFTNIAIEFGDKIPDLPMASKEVQSAFDQSLAAFVNSNASQLHKWLRSIVMDEAHLLATVKEDGSYWTGVVSIASSWMKLSEAIPFDDHPEYDSVGAELAFECFCRISFPTEETRKLSIQWLEAYFPLLERMPEETGELYVDALVHLSSSVTASLLEKVGANLPRSFEFTSERINAKLHEFGLR